MAASRHHHEVGCAGRLSRRGIGPRPPWRCVDQRHVATEAGEPLQFGADLADRATQYRRLRRAAPLPPIHGRQLGIEVDHGHVAPLLYGRNGEVQGERGFPAATLGVDDCDGVHAALSVLGALAVRTVHTTIVGAGAPFLEARRPPPALVPLSLAVVHGSGGGAAWLKKRRHASGCPRPRNESS